MVATIELGELMADVLLVVRGVARADYFLAINRANLITSMSHSKRVARPTARIEEDAGVESRDKDYNAGPESSSLAGGES